MKSSKWFALECKNTALVCAKFVNGFIETKQIMNKKLII